MNPSNIVVSQGSLDTLKALRTYLRSEGIASEMVRPPGDKGG